MLVDEDGWLIRTSAGRRAVGGRRTMRKPRSGSWRGCGGVRPALWCSGGRRASGRSNTLIAGQPPHALWCLLEHERYRNNGVNLCGLHEEDS